MPLLELYLTSSAAGTSPSASKHADAPEADDGMSMEMVMSTASYRNLARCKEVQTSRSREFSLLADHETLKDMPRLSRRSQHDEAHSLAIQAFLFASTVLLCALPYPFVPIVGFLFAFIEARLLVVRHVFGSKAELPRATRDDMYQRLCSFIAIVAFFTNGCVGVFTELFNWDAVRFEILYIVVICLLIGPFVLGGIQYIVFMSFESCSSHRCCCGRVSAESIIRSAEQWYSMAEDQVFLQAQRVKLHKRERGGLTISPGTVTLE
jgi:hypothetical protein